MEAQQHPLVGKKIAVVEISADKMALRFVLTDGECIAKCDADCCSHTWVEHIELPALGLPATVISLENVGGAQPDSSDGELKFYGCKIITDRGEIFIDYRKSSNGYYGGSLSWPGDHFYGGVFNQNVADLEWQALQS